MLRWVRSKTDGSGHAAGQAAYIWSTKAVEMAPSRTSSSTSFGARLVGDRPAYDYTPALHLLHSRQSSQYTHANLVVYHTETAKTRKHAEQPKHVSEH